MVLLFGLMSRAVFVPSTATRTAILGLLVGVPHLLLAYVRARDAAASSLVLDFWQEFGLRASTRSPATFAFSATLVQFIWWSFSIVLAAATSKVTFGLRAQMLSMRKMGQYTLDEKIGEGGMGIVYRAHHALLRRPTAIKVLPPERAGAVALARFEREVQRTAELTHPSTITVYDYGRTPDGLFYYAMEYLEGATLDDLVEIDGPQPAERVVHILRGVSHALIEAHERGLIHRDIKPANIMLVEQGGVLDVPKVLDFGLVKDIESDGKANLSGVGQITGTPQYIAPEAVLEPDTVDGRSDLYTLGAVGYYLLTGTHLFGGQSVVEVCSHHLHAEPESISERRGDDEIPPDLEAVIMRCLAKKQEDRFDSARSFSEALEALAPLRGEWAQAEARAWWTRYARQVAARRIHAPVSPSAKTIDVQRD